MLGIYYYAAMLTTSAAGAVGQYSGAVFGSKSVLKEVMATDGVRGMFKGSTPIFVRSVPANAACFCGYEVCLSLLTKAGLE
jgi:hypothetical protein